MAKFRKKPVVIEAAQFKGVDLALKNLDEAVRFDDWLCQRQQFNTPCRYVGNSVVIPTLEGDMTALPGDWIICGVNGELYPCKPDIFAKTYDEVK